MAINNVIVQYNEFLPDILLLTQAPIYVWFDGTIIVYYYTSPGEERGNETGKVAIAHGSVEFCEAIPIGLADES